MARLVHELATALATRHTVLLLRPGSRSSFSQPSQGSPGYLQIESLGQGEVLIPRLNGASLYDLNLELESFSPDIVHAQDFSPLALYIQDWARARRIPFLLTLHLMPSRSQSFGSEEKPAWMVRISNGRLFRRFVRRYLNRCDALTSLNRAHASDLRSFGCNRPIHEVPNGRDFKSLCLVPAASMSAPRKKLLFVGSFARRKNQLYLLEVLRHLPDNIHLELLGETLEPGYLELLQKRVQQLALSDRVSIGRCEHRDIPAHLQVAHLFVSASTLEVQSLAVLEALASGTPVVGLSNQTIDELVDDAVGSRLPADAPPEVFARRISELLALTPDAYSALCARARERVSRFDWPVVLERLNAVYCEIAGQPAKKRLRPVWTPWLRTASWFLWNAAALSSVFAHRAAPQ